MVPLGLNAGRMAAEAMLSPLHHLTSNLSCHLLLCHQYNNETQTYKKYHCGKTMIFEILNYMYNDSEMAE